MQSLTRSVRLVSTCLASAKNMGVRLQPAHLIMMTRLKSHQGKSKPTPEIAPIGHQQGELPRHREEKHAKEVKNPKTLTLNGKIAAHDLESKVKNIQRWLKKGHRVNTTIQGDAELAEQLYLRLETALQGEARLLQKRNKDGEIRFYIDSIPKPTEKES